MSLIGHAHGAHLVDQIADTLGAPMPRDGSECQRIPYVTAAGERHPRLNDALRLMEANTEEPLDTETIARLVGVSRRQLERLFRQHLDVVPSRYYLELRLAKARSYLLHTGKGVLQIGLACGFTSAAHFSNTYRERYGMSPREDRRCEMARRTP